MDETPPPLVTVAEWDATPEGQRRDLLTGRDPDRDPSDELWAARALDPEFIEATDWRSGGMRPLAGVVSPAVEQALSLRGAWEHQRAHNWVAWGGGWYTFDPFTLQAIDAVRQYGGYKDAVQVGACFGLHERVEPTGRRPRRRRPTRNVPKRNRWAAFFTRTVPTPEQVTALDASVGRLRVGNGAEVGPLWDNCFSSAYAVRRDRVMVALFTKHGPTLRAAYADPDPAVRAGAILNPKTAPDPTVVSSTATRVPKTRVAAVEAAAADPDPRPRLAAAARYTEVSADTFAALIRDPAVTDAARAGFRFAFPAADWDDAAAVISVFTGSKDGNAGVVPYAHGEQVAFRLAALAHPSPDVRTVAFHALTYDFPTEVVTDADVPGYVTAVYAYMYDDPDPAVRAAVIGALGCPPDLRKAAVTDPDPTVRLALLADEYVRRNLDGSGRRYRENRPDDALLTVLADDPDPQVRDRVQEILVSAALKRG